MSKALEGLRTVGTHIRIPAQPRCASSAATQMGRGLAILPPEERVALNRLVCNPVALK